MRIITLNANGIRAAERKGFFQWLRQQNADVVCIQETKAQVEQLKADAFWPTDYHCFYHDAEKKGYSGVAIYCKKSPARSTRASAGKSWMPRAVTSKHNSTI
nr:endonuclease/exonuclease/phosphatase family protein [Methylomarinum sp. Ch1-1]MDP4522138.1 endonuclease/exonuclease/phosphatase family protein [Methylomarinum sp. Ch1-1]